MAQKKSSSKKSSASKSASKIKKTTESAKSMPAAMTRKLHDLVNFNRLMFVLHFIQGVVVLAVSGNSQRVITTGILAPEDPAASEEAFRLIPERLELFTVELAPLVALFFFVSAMAHFYVSFINVEGYKKDLLQGINKARWYEYSISASIMVVIVAMLSGIFDAGSLLGIFALTAVMNLMGLIMELWNQGKKKISWLSYNIGVFAGVIPWVIVALSLWATQSQAMEGQGIPTFVFWIFVSIFIFFNSFAINMVLQYTKFGRWADYLYGERAYIVLSLVAKSALAWQVYGGTLQPV